MAELTKLELEEKIIQTLKTCYDPEIPVDIFELGLIYEIAIDDKSKVKIKMTLTSPACPVAGSLPPEVEAKVKSIPEVNDAKIELVWSPLWDKDKLLDRLSRKRTGEPLPSAPTLTAFLLDPEAYRVL